MRLIASVVPKYNGVLLEAVKAAIPDAVAGGLSDGGELLRMNAMSNILNGGHGLTGQLQSVVSRFYAVGAPAAKKWALLLTSGSPNVYAAIETQYRGILGFIQAESLGIFEYDGKRSGTEEAANEVKAFGASL